ncbi:MAG: DNA-deoxyinosine glycosylase [Bacillota bacterium]|nr:DNA-deoxyinosine glycosylase [Bacillota bacterium]
MQGFSPVSHENCRVLVLGSFPSVESRMRQEYYAHRQNSFWKIMFAMFSEPYSKNYDIKKELLLSHDVALWDVLLSHEGEGSADSNIKEPVPNDFTSFFPEHRRIVHIFFNGGTAERLFSELIGKESVPYPVRYTRLFSTSPANARYRFEEKLQNWSQILNELRLK